MNEQAINKARETHLALEELMVKKIQVEIQHAKEIEKLNREIMALQAKLSAALSLL